MAETRLTASDKARRRWAAMELRRDFPVDCGLPACHRAFKTERGAAQHRRRCWHNPDAPCFTSGDYDPIVTDSGAIVGFIYNGRSEQERRRIREGHGAVAEALGLRSRTHFGPSHRKVTLGPDPTEPCAVCPESREDHTDLVGACRGPGCRCRTFVGATA